MVSSLSDHRPSPDGFSAPFRLVLTTPRFGTLHQDGRVGRSRVGGGGPTRLVVSPSGF